MPSFTSKFLKKRFIDKGPKELQGFADRAAPIVQVADKIIQGGGSVAEPIIGGGPQGFAADLASAQAVSGQSNNNFGASNYDEFNSQYGEYHGSVVVTARAVAGSKTQPDAYVRQITEAMTSAARKFGEIAGRKLLGPSGQSIAQVTNVAVATGKMLLSLRGDVFNFTPGMVVQAASGDGTGAVTVRAGQGFVVSVFPDTDGSGAQLYIATSSANQAAGTLGLPSGWTNNDFLFRNGDVAAATISDNQIRSVQSWITLVAANDTFNGVARSQDARYSGVRVAAADVAGLSITDRMQLLATELKAQAGASDVDYFFLGPRTWQQAASEAQSYGRYDMGGDPKLGVPYGFTLMTCIGPIKVASDAHCLEADIWAVTSKDLKIYNYDGFPGLDTGDGVELLRQSANAGYEIRYHAFNCVTVNAVPWHFGRCASGN